jgi:hypothetical protein
MLYLLIRNILRVTSLSNTELINHADMHSLKPPAEVESHKEQVKAEETVGQSKQELMNSELHSFDKNISSSSSRSILLSKKRKIVESRSSKKSFFSRKRKFSEDGPMRSS